MNQPPMSSGGALASPIEVLESRIAPAADFIATVLALDFLQTGVSDTAVPGTEGNVTFVIKNNGPDAAVQSAATGIHIYLSADGQLQLGTDLKLTSKQHVDHTYAPQEQKQFTVKFRLPAAKLPNPAFPPDQSYFILAEADAGFRVSNEATHANNDGASAPFLLGYQFGNVGARSGVPLHVQDSDGTFAAFNLKGPGTGMLELAGSNVNLSVTGTTVKTGDLRAIGGGGDGQFKVHDISVDGPVGAVFMPDVDVTGNVAFAQGMKGLDLGNILPTSAQKTFSIGPIAGLIDATLGRVADVTFTSPAAFKMFSVVDWTNTNSTADALEAPFIKRLIATGDEDAGVTGDFVTNLTLNGAEPTGFTLRTVVIAGEIGASLWELGNPATSNDGVVSSIKAGSAFEWRLKTEGFVGDVDIVGDFQAPSAVAALEAPQFGDIHIGGNFNGPVAMPALKAMHFNNIDVDGALNASIEATGESPGKFAIRELHAGTVMGGVMINAPEAGILKVSVGEWLNDGAITTKWLKKLTATGDFDANLTLTGPDIIPDPKKLKLDAPSGIKGSLGTARIGGAITGDLWQLELPAQEIHAASTAANWNYMGAPGGSVIPGGRIGTLEVSGVMHGHITAPRIDKLEATGALTADISLTWEVGVLQSLVAGSVVGANLDVKGRIDSIKVQEWNGGPVLDSIKAKAINEFIVTGNPKTGVQGDLAFVEIDLSGSFLGAAMGKLEVAGRMDSILVTAPAGGILFIKADKWSDVNVEAERVETVSLSGNVHNSTLKLQDDAANLVPSVRNFSAGGLVSGFGLTAPDGIHSFTAGAIAFSGVATMINANGGNIDSFTIKGLDGVGVAFDHGTKVMADKITKIIVRDVNAAPAPGGEDFGIFTGEIVTSYKRFVGDSTTPAHEEGKVTSGGELERQGNYVLNVT